MKKLFIYSLIALAGMFHVSCSDDLLNTKPLDKYTELDVWNDINLTQGFIYNTYGSVIPELLVNPNDPDPITGGLGSDFATDNMLRGKTDVVALDLMDRYFNAGWAKNNSYYWWNPAPLGRKDPIKKNTFEVIRDCNLIIEKVAASKGIADIDKPELIAQGKMLRALIYYAKARVFGKYVIVDKVLTTDAELKLPRTKTIKETYDFIVKDLQEAVLDLPLKGERGNGHFTQGAAYAMLAEIALQGAAYIETGKQEYYQIAKTASEKVLGLGYSLEEDYEGLFNDYDVAQGSDEIILAQFKHVDATMCRLTPMQRLVPNMEVAKTGGVPTLKESFLGWPLCWPSFDLVEAYLAVDVDGVAKKWDETSYYDNFMTNGGWVSKDIHGHRDARLYASIVLDSTMLFTNTVTTRLGGNMHYKESKKGINASTPSGFFIRKGIYNVDGFHQKTYTGYHHCITRLGRAYLNYAEVMLRLNDPETAIEYINKTRTTHGQLPALTSGLSIDEVWKWYKIERRVELFMENDRYWSLLRWGKEAGDIIIPELNGVAQKFFEISADGKSFEIKDLEIRISEQNCKFTPKRYLFPVPQDEIELNDLLDQNPGWE